MVNGEHAEHLLERTMSRISAVSIELISILFDLVGARWPKVAFLAPTYSLGGSNCSSTPQGGYYKIYDFFRELIMTLTFGDHKITRDTMFGPLRVDVSKNRELTNIDNHLYPALRTSKSFTS